MIDVGVIIVDYQSDPLLETALIALSNTQFVPLKTIVIENNPVKPRTKFPDNLGIQFIRSEANIGFGAAVNLARRQLDTPFFFLLNPDVQILPETISILQEYMKGNSTVGLVVPKLLNPDGTLQLSARTFYTLTSILLRRSFLGKLRPNDPSLREHLMSDWDHATIRTIDWALGACMLIRAEAVGDEIFDPRYFLYFEDVDLCLHLKKNGWKVVYHPEAIATHHHRQTSRKSLFCQANYHHMISWFKFVTKYKSISGL